jgi:orotidine-5'-phosphate decarboxylase
VAVYEDCNRLIEQAGSACVAVKPQLACFERLGQHGWWALDEVCRAAHREGLLVVADGKRGDVPVTAAAYGQALVGETETPWGLVEGLGADAFTANPLLGDDAIEVLVEAAAAASAGVFLLVRTSNPGASRLQDLSVSRPRTRSGGAGDHAGPLHEELALLVAESAPKLAGESGLSGVGAVVGATAPQHMGRLRELMPDSVFLIPGIGVQGGKPEDLRPALAPGRPASILVAASRSIARSDDPAGAAEELRDAVWSLAA